MSVDLEYAIKKDIRNNPVVREIDLQQKRDFYRTLLVVGGVVAMLLFSAFQHFRVVSSGYRIEELRSRLGQEEAVNRRLKLEIEVWQRPQLIEERAVRQLQMVVPSARDTVVIERVAAPAPAKSIVAAVR